MAYILEMYGTKYLGLCYGNYDGGSIQKWDLLNLSDGSFRKDHTIEYYDNYDYDSESASEWGWLDDDTLNISEYHSMRAHAEAILGSWGYWDRDPATASDILAGR